MWVGWGSGPARGTICPDMTSTVLPIDIDLSALLARLTLLDRTAASELAIVEERLPELRRQAAAGPKRRNGRDSLDAEKYRLGSLLVLLGFRGVDDLALLGLLASGDCGLTWLAEARLHHGPMPFADLARAAVADSKRADWCRAWGEYRWRAYKKPLYDAAVSAFLESGRAGLDEAWRARPITRDQSSIIGDICATAGHEPPDVQDRGEAFEWILKHGGNPAYWREPEQPEDWEE